MKKDTYTPEEIVDYIRLYRKVQKDGRAILRWTEKTNYEQTPMLKAMVKELKKNIKGYLDNVPKEIREKISFGFKIIDLEKLSEDPFITISSKQILI